MCHFPLQFQLGVNSQNSLKLLITREESREFKIFSSMSKTLANGRTKHKQDTENAVINFFIKRTKKHKEWKPPFPYFNLKEVKTHHINKARQLK